MKLTLKKSPILKAAVIQIGLVSILSLGLILSFSFINTNESHRKIKSIYEALEGKINEEFFINHSIKVKNDNLIHSLNNFKSQVYSNDIQASVVLESCNLKSDIKYKITSVDGINKCVLITLKDHSIISSVKNTALIIVLLILLSIPIYHFAFSESLRSESFKARSDLADEVVHGVGSPLARFDLGLRSIRNKVKGDDLRVLESVYDDFKYQFLKLSYDEVLEDEKIKTDMVSLINLVLRSRREKLSDSITIKFDSANSSIFSLINPKIVREILDNIINNSIHALKGEGLIEVSLIEKGRSLVLRVKDNGEGISSKNIPLIFNKGFSTKMRGASSGLGIGLYHSKLKLEHMGGEISLKSSLGVGTTVDISLDLLSESISSSKKQKKIVMIDDDSFLLRTSKKTFEALGYKIDVYNSPESFLDVIKEISKDSLVLYDMRFHNSNLDGLYLRRKCIESGFQTSDLILISSLADKISSRLSDSILSVSKNNFNDVISFVKAINPRVS